MGMTAVAIIPARAGSKRVPGKNVRPLGGKPLISHTTDAVLSSGVFGHVIVSSDDPEVEKLYAGDDKISFDPRPSDLAADDVQCHDVLHYLIERYRLAERFDYLCLAQATCPLRTAEQFRASWSLVENHRPDSVIGVRRFAFPPRFALQIKDGRIVREWDGIVRTDDMIPRYHPNGAITWLRIDWFHANRMQSYYAENTLPFIMDWRSSVDIDEEEDFELAEAVMFHAR